MSDAEPASSTPAGAPTEPASVPVPGPATEAENQLAQQWSQMLQYQMQGKAGAMPFTGGVPFPNVPFMQVQKGACKDRGCSPRWKPSLWSCIPMHSPPYPQCPSTSMQPFMYPNAMMYNPALSGMNPYTAAFMASMAEGADPAKATLTSTTVGCWPGLSQGAV